MKHNSVVINTLHGLGHSFHLITQLKNAISKRSAKSQLLVIDDSLIIQYL